MSLAATNVDRPCTSSAAPWVREPPCSSSSSFPAGGRRSLRLGADPMLGERVEDVFEEEVVLPAAGQATRFEAAVIGHGHHRADVEPEELGNLGRCEDGRVVPADRLPPRLVLRRHGPSILLPPPDDAQIPSATAECGSCIICGFLLRVLQLLRLVGCLRLGLLVLVALGLSCFLGSFVFIGVGGRLFVYGFTPSIGFGRPGPVLGAAAGPGQWMWATGPE